MFTGKTLMITGGTGSFGNAILNSFLATDIGEIRIFSRDELKQDNMRHLYQQKYPEYSGSRVDKRLTPQAPHRTVRAPFTHTAPHSNIRF